jgi:hypothetical protein
MIAQRQGRRFLPIVGWGVGVIAVAQSTAAPVSSDAMKACTAVDDPSARLACYDRLSGRAPGASASSVASGSSVAGSSVTQSSISPVAPSNTSTPGPTGAAPKETFGLYSAEHPTQPSLPKSITSKVVALGVRPNGHPSVTLEGGQLWEMESADALLGSGDTVTIQRGVLGSFIMTTPDGRTYRVYRAR